MDIKEKIERLKREIKESQRNLYTEDKSQTVEKLRILLREEARGKKRIENIDELADHLDAQVFENNYGKFIVKEELLENEFYGEDVERIHVLAKEDIFKNFNLSNNIFLDLETSGLSGGVGTFAFLVGIGYLEKDNFKIKQFFLPDLPSEKALLLEVALFLKDFESITTFNGKAFDLPLLTSRYRLNLLEEPDFDLHLDLLHVARRVYKRSFADRSLSSLEEKLLGKPRKSDIASNLIPDVYFNFLRTNEVSLLGKVIKHNEIDIFSMLKLLSHFVALLQRLEEIQNPEVLYSISRLYTELKDNDTSIRLMKRALRYTENISFIFEVKRDLSIIYKRFSMWEKAEKLWTELLSETPFEPFPYIELAKFYEHRLRDFKKAKEIINILKEKLGEGWEFCTYDDILKRDIRLDRKMEKD